MWVVFEVGMDKVGKGECWLDGWEEEGYVGVEEVGSMWVCVGVGEGWFGWGMEGFWYGGVVVVGGGVCGCIVGIEGIGVLGRVVVLVVGGRGD